MTLKSEFVSMIAGQLKEELPAFLKAMEEPAVRGLRLNRRFVREEDLPDLMGPVSWAADGYYLSADSRLGQSPAHEAGAFYIQEPSAMAAAEVLAPGPNDLVLDLCAAPGGKSTQLSKKLSGGTLVANEVHPARAKILSSNIERMGCTNTVVTSAAPEKLCALWPDTFDAILVDAPCSGEGMFRKNPEAAEEWQPGSPAGCAERQKGILDCAAKMLRPGGRLAYSTCTFNRLENDEQIAAFLSRHPEFEALPFALNGLPEAMDGTLHLWPHQVRGEGHFIALLRKKDGPCPKPALSPLPAPDKAALAAAKDALTAIAQDAEAVLPNALFGDLLVRLPPSVPPLRGVQVLRAGLSVGRLRGKTFVPDHALSRVCRPKTVFPVSEEEALAYLRGETLALKDDHVRGFGVVTLNQLPLGFGKASDGQIKNHYPKGLRK